MEPAAPTVRAATISDLETLVHFNLAMALETEGRSLDATIVRRGVAQVLNEPTRGVYFVAEQGSNVVGQMLITYEWSDWRDGLFWWIQSVYVVPAARGSGVYRALHTYVEQVARRNERVCGLRLYVEQANRHAQEIYEHVGMHATSYRLYEVDWSGSPHNANAAVLTAAADGNAAGTHGAPRSAHAAYVEAHQTPITIDLYCLTCGYNLRGLAGDPCRCPECGNRNPRGDMEIPAALITRQLRRMETWPALGVGIAALTIIFAALLGRLVWLGGGPRLIPPAFAVICLTAIWFLSVHTFRRSCLNRTGWLATLVRYHLVGLVGVSVVLALAIGAGNVLRGNSSGRFIWSGAGWLYYVVMVLITGAVIAGLKLAVGPISRFAKGEMETLQREVAVEIARRELRQRLRRRH